MEGLELCIGAGFFLREVPFGRCRSFRKLEDSQPAWKSENKTKMNSHGEFIFSAFIPSH